MLGRRRTSQVRWEMKKQKKERSIKTFLWGLFLLGQFQMAVRMRGRATFVATSRTAFVVVSSSFVLS